jgi:phosphohistidine phosphatase SixA
VDRFRRLDDEGRMTARQLVWSLADREITEILSSPLARCVETVVPIAASRGLAVDQRGELAPDSALEDVTTLLLDLPETALACTHREIFELLLGWEAPCEKGAIWVVEKNGSELVPTLYVEAPTGLPTHRQPERTSA